MPLDVEARDPELDTVALELPEAGLVLDRWESYSFASHYLTPSDGFSFTTSDDLSAVEFDALGIGSEVVLTVNGTRQSAGYIDKIGIHNDRKSGTRISISGRDKLGYVVDSGLDPRTVFTDGMTLEDLLVAVFKPFGIEFLLTDNDDNRAAISNTRGTKTSKKGKPLKSFVLHQTKPYPHEGAFQFAARVCQRHGLYIQPSVEGLILIVAKPNFDQNASYRLRRKRGEAGAQNNILSGSVDRDGTNQPSVLLASGLGGGGEFAHSTLRAGAVNPFVEADVASVINAWPNLEFMSIDDEAASIGGPNYAPVSFKSKRARPLYLYDQESQTQEQIENYVRREMSMRMQHAFTAHYEVAGHVCNGAVWNVDTIVLVDDEIGRLQEPMWIVGRTFDKSRKGGTKTHLELIRPGSLVL